MVGIEWSFMSRAGLQIHFLASALGPEYMNWMGVIEMSGCSSCADFDPRSCIVGKKKVLMVFQVLWQPGFFLKATI